MPERKSAEENEKEGRRRIDLSAVQVAASALATVVGALLASELGVYGTVLGAAVVSVGATVGGAVFQHLFRRTGEQLRGAVERGPAPAPTGRSVVPDGPPPPPGAWSAPRVVRARRRWTWRSYLAVSALVFTVAMVPIVAFELVTGQPVAATVRGDSGNGTSLGGTVTPRPSGTPADGPSGAPTGTLAPTSTGTPSGGGRSPAATPTPDGGATPSASPSGGTASPSAPSTAPSTAPPSSPSAGDGEEARDGGGPSGAASPKPLPGAPTAAPSGAAAAR